MLDSVNPGRFARILFVALLALTVPAAASAAARVCTGPLSSGIPGRALRAPSGSAVMQRLLDTGGTARDDAVVGQVLSGNVPSFLRHLVPVSIPGTLASGRAVLVTICVTPGYLAVGDDRDFVRVPMGLAAAARVASELGFVLPTTRMVDAIYSQAAVRVSPSPMQPTDQMSSTAYLLQHNRTLESQRNRTGHSPAELIAGEKKDIVLTTRLQSNPGRVAIYGWHRQNGKPIQPLSTVHGASYADYSHGVRLVSQTAYVDGRPLALAEILRDRDLAPIVSSEGPIGDIAGLMASLY